LRDSRDESVGVGIRILRQLELLYLESRPLDMLGISRLSEEQKVPQAIVGKWGKNLAVRLPGQVAKAAGLTNGEQVEIEARDGDIVIRRPIPRFTLEELFRGRSASQGEEVYCRGHSTGDQTPAARSSSSDIACVYSYRRRSHLDRFRSDQRKGTGRPTTAS